MNPLPRRFTVGDSWGGLRVHVASQIFDRLAGACLGKGDCRRLPPSRGGVDCEELFLGELAFGLELVREVVDRPTLLPLLHFRLVAVESGSNIEWAR